PSVKNSADRLSGRIPCVLGAARAQRLLVPVHHVDATSLWLGDSAAGGMGVHPRPLLDRSRDVADITLDGVAARRLDIDAAEALGEIATRAAVLAAADALGASERMLQLAVDYSKQRHQFGQPIGSFQAVKHAAAQMLVTVESSLSIVCYAAQSAEECLPERATHAAVAKAQVTGSGAELADSALTLHGAIGYTWEHDLHLFYKRGEARPRAVRRTDGVERAHRQRAAACPSLGLIFPVTSSSDHRFHFGLSISMIEAKFESFHPVRRAENVVDFELSEDQQTIRAAVAELAGKFDDHYWLTKDQRHEFPTEFYDAFAEGGWLGITTPEDYGGHGFGITEASILLEEVAASGGGMNAASSMHLSIFGMHPVIVHGSEELKARTLPRIVTGDLHVCFGVTEPGAGLDTTKITTFARREGDHYIVSGRKVWISKALESEKVLLLTRTTKFEDVARKTDGLTLFLTDLDRSKIDIRPIPKMGRNAVSSNELFIDGLEVPVEDRVGEEGQGFRYILDGLNPERCRVAAEALGIGRAALRAAVRYGNEREVFGRPIGMNQGLQFPRADSLARLDAAELILRKATWLYDNGKPCAREANTAKDLCADAGFDAADRALQTHGGMGYSEEYHVARYFREARLTRIAPISQEMVLNYLGEHVLGLPRSY
ncbi:MAG: acyl-CoA dehydrogenase, partial [Mycobacterium sp.]|nr:acyl-CoA dehydrogenase [Mycobacterium sp.]